MRQTYWTEEKVKLLRQVYKNPEALSDIVTKFFPTKHIGTVKDKARKLGLKRPVDVPNRYVKNGSLLPLLEETPEIYYWIGFIFADGHISKNHRLSVILSDKDALHLKKLATLLKTKTKCYICKAGSGYADHDIGKIRMQIMDVKAGRQIVKKFNLKHNKTYMPPTIQIFKNMSDVLFLSWLIGFIDGDGAISLSNNKPRIKLSNYISWITVYKYIRKRLTNILNIEFPKCRLNKKRNLVSWEFSKKEVTKILKKHTIEHNLPTLFRKWSKIKNG